MFAPPIARPQAITPEPFTVRRIQSRLAIGAVDHPLELEADRIARQVMRSPGSRMSVLPARRMSQERPAEIADREARDIVHEALRSPGQPLDAASRTFFEPRFGQDFSRVRVHTSAVAARSARAVGARAYTLGSDVVFAAGQYAPHSYAGTRLLAHELAHVAQQDRAPATILRQTESVHPEEQYCEDISKDPTASCAAIISCIESLIEELAGRFDQLRGDPGHATRIVIVQGILRALMAMALITCKNGEYDKELQEEAEKWAGRKPGQPREPAAEEQKKTLRERLPSVPGWVWAVIGAAAVALIIACFATGVCEAGAILAAAGEVAGMIILGAMRLAHAL